MTDPTHATRPTGPTGLASRRSPRGRGTTPARTRARRGRLRLVSGLVLLLVAAGMALAGASSAQEAPSGSVSAFTLTARGHLLRLTFDTPGALPVGPLLELTAPESRAGLSTGDAGSAFSSVGYPGPVLTGLPQILATTGADASGLPPYPFVAEATTSGPTDVIDTTSLPGSTMSAVARDGRAVADTRTPALALPTVVGLGTLHSHAEAAHDDQGVTATASAELTDVDLLGGLLHVGALRSTAAARSQGGKPSGTASTDVVDATFLGAPVTITADGIQLAPGQSVQHQLVSTILAPLGGPNGLLASTGLRIRAGAVARTITDDTANLGAEGLTLEVNGRLDTSALQQLLAQLPPLPTIPGLPVQLADAIAVLGSDQVRSLSVGQVAVGLTARGDAGTDEATDGGSPVDLGTGGLGSTDVPAFGDLPDLSGGAGTTGGGTAGAGTGGVGGSDGSPLPPLPASGALAAIGGGLVLSAGLRRFADAALEPAGAAAADCDLVGPPDPSHPSPPSDPEEGSHA